MDQKMRQLKEEQYEEKKRQREKALLYQHQLDRQRNEARTRSLLSLQGAFPFLSFCLLLF